MAAEVESMFYEREKPWHGLGTEVAEALSSEEAIIEAGLNWSVLQESVFTAMGEKIPGYKVNIRDTDNKVLGVVTSKYKIVQNREAFSFTDKLLGKGVRYETAGSLMGGRKIWLLAKLPEKYKIFDDEVVTYLVFSNAHDGSSAVKVAVTPIRVVCNNTLNLALRTAKRSWSMIHTGSIYDKIHEAESTLFMTSTYMDSLNKEAEKLYDIKIDDAKVKIFINMLLPIKYGASKMQTDNILKLRNDLFLRYQYAPDLQGIGKNGYRFVNAVSDYVNHEKPLRFTKSYNENLFIRTMNGNTLVDKAYQFVLAA